MEYLENISREDNDSTIDIDSEADFSSIGGLCGFDGFDKRLDDDMLQDDDSILYDVAENCHGTVTRESGRLARNDILNIINRRHARIVLDFSKVATVSSSFVDELVAKMFVGLGLLRFNQMITIKGMKRTVRYLCERSSYMRIYDEWLKNASGK